jgi:hypothetical protein
MDPEPTDSNAVDAGPHLDIPDSLAVTREILQMRRQELQAGQRPNETPQTPLISRCVATLHVSVAQTPQDPPMIRCSDPHSEDVMRRAIVATGTLRALPGSTVLLRVNAPFPAL